jgi:hypothetical protein
MKRTTLTLYVLVCLTLGLAIGCALDGNPLDRVGIIPATNPTTMPTTQPGVDLIGVVNSPALDVLVLGAGGGAIGVAVLALLRVVLPVIFKRKTPRGAESVNG